MGETENGRPTDAATQVTRQVDPHDPTVTGHDATPRSGRGDTAGRLGVNEVLGGRYRIVRYIAGGGMGDVYEVEDLDLGERIALKTLSAGVSADERSRDRFKRELQLARKVTHPNVCRVFDVGYDRGLNFFTMELIDGEELSTRLARVGRLATADALPIVAQLTAALDSAHGADVIHRDFKSHNIMIAPGVDGDRVVVMDFGLARGRDADDRFSASATGTGDIVGTPAYMAPEQVEAGELGPATDIYSLGIVMYEMVTGERPFAADTALAIAAKRLSHRPSSPRSIVPDLDRAWDTAIMRCLERRPDDRFERAGDVLRVLRGESVPPPRGRWRRRIGVAVVAALVVGIAAVAYLAAPRSSGPIESRAGDDDVVVAPSATGRRSIALVSLRNLTQRADADWLATAFSELLGAQLAAGGDLRVVSVESVARLAVELDLASSAGIDAPAMRTMRKSLGADLVVSGSYVAHEGGTVEIAVKLIDTVTHEAVGYVTDKGAQTDLLALATRTATVLRGKLAVEPIEADEAAALGAVLPADPAARQLYAAGIGRLRVYDWIAARELLQRAVEIEPEHPLIHSELGDLLYALGDESGATVAAKRALDLSATLPRGARMLVEGRYRVAAGDYAGAVKIYRALADASPDDLEAGLLLVEALVDGFEPIEAVQVARGLRRMPSPAGGDPRIDIFEGWALYLSGQIDQAIQLLERGERKAAGDGTRLVVAGAQLRLAWVYGSAGRFDDADRVLVAARGVFDEVGDLFALGQIGESSAVRHSLDGKLARALDDYQAAVDYYTRVGATTMAYSANGRASSAALARGDVDTALTAASAALELALASAVKQHVGGAQVALADVLLAKGDFAAAASACDAALASAASTPLAPWVRVCHGDVALASGDLEGATLAYEQALTMLGGAVQPRFLAAVRLSQADIATRGERPADAIGAAREALSIFERQNKVAARARALAVLAIAQLDGAEGADARRSIELAVSLVAESENTHARLQVSYARGVVLMASGDAVAGRALLTEVQREAAGLGLGLLAGRAAAAAR